MLSNIEHKDEFSRVKEEYKYLMQMIKEDKELLNLTDEHFKSVTDWYFYEKYNN